ncbi:MAG: lipoyl(octanoyl) transferase [Bacteroidia bacterium]|jgi:lipoyl(octanoyl) transferase|tara:strand:+ start:8875 stop:9534 length:660 start_codon:yes stop_codon:yes gene_type:complete
MEIKLKFKNIGLKPYAEALNVQQEVHQTIIDGGTDTLILCEHPHVYTFGKSADITNLLVDADFLKTIDAEVYETDRGGDITYHGPGQLVAYPIINLRKHGIGVKKYVETLEVSIINTLESFNILAYQIEGLTGIWVGEESEVKRKIGAIGIRVRNGVSMHGFALNVTTDLSYFNHIVPCGIANKEVTSIYQETGSGSVTEFALAFQNTFQTEWQKALDL